MPVLATAGGPLLLMFLGKLDTGAAAQRYLLPNSKTSGQRQSM